MPSCSAGCRSTSTTASSRSANGALRDRIPTPIGIRIPSAASRPRITPTGSRSNRCSSRSRRSPAAPFTLREPGAEPEDLRAQRVTAGFFDVLRVRPAIGRAFTADNEVDGRQRLVVLSDGLWRRRFGGDPGIVGRTIPLEGGAYEVVGVMPADFQYPVGSLRPTDLWIPYVVPPDERTRVIGSRSYYLQSIARLKPGVSLQQAQAQMTQVGTAVLNANPVWNKDHLIGVRPLIDHMLGARTKSWMLMLLGAVGIVLLIACANVANLLLARATAREREVGIRAALGAGRWRLIRQLMVESLVLSILGTVLATVLAWWAVQVLRTAMPDGVPRVAAIAVDLRVLAAAAAMALITGTPVRNLPGAAAIEAGPDRGVERGGPRRQQRPRASADAQRSRGDRGRPRGRAPGRRCTLHRQLHVVDAHRSWFPVRERADGAGLAAVSTGPDRAHGQRRGGIRADRRASTPDAGGHPRRDDFRRDAARRQHELDRDDRAGRKVDDPTGISIRRVTPDYHRVLRIPLKAGRLFEAYGSHRVSQTSPSSASSRQRNTSPVRMPSGRR